MSDSLFDAKVRELRDRTASADPTPGGGSIAAVTAAFGLGLVIMAAEITRRAKPGELDAWIADARTLLGAISDAADRDVAVFDNYMRALALPKTNDAEKAARKRALGAASPLAARVPLDLAKDIVRALHLAGVAARSVKASVASDVLAGADILEGACRAALRNVDVNLPAIGDANVVAELERARREAEAEAARLYAVVVGALQPKAEGA